MSRRRSSGEHGGLNVTGLILFLAIAIVTIVSIIFMYQGQRRIPVQQARRVVGRKMFAGRASYIPLRLNNAGVISIIFAISILLLAAAGAVVVRAQRRNADVLSSLRAVRGADEFGRRLALDADLVRPELVALQPRLLLPGRDVHVLL